MNRADQRPSSKQARRVALAVVLLAVAGLGCGTVYRVSTDPKCGGIPFLPIESADVETLVAEQSWARIEVTTTFLLAQGGPKKAKPFTTTLVAYATDLTVAMTLSATFNSAESPVAAHKVVPAIVGLLATRKLLPAAPPPVDWKDTKNLQVVLRKRGTIQRPGRTHLYLNAKVPVGGTGKLDVELSDKGTLAKASGEQQDQLPGTIATAVTGLLGTDAATAVVGKLLGVPDKEPTEDKKLMATAPFIVGVEMHVTPERRRYTATATRSSEPKGSCNLESILAGQPAQDCDVTQAIEMVKSDAKDGDDDDDKGAIDFSGRIKMPKPAGDDDKKE